MKEGVAEDGEASVPVDVKENGIGGCAADNEPVAEPRRPERGGYLPPLNYSFFPYFAVPRALSNSPTVSDAADLWPARSTARTI